MTTGQLLRIGSVANLANSLAAAMDGFEICCRAKGLSPNTLIFYHHRLAAFQRFLNEHASSSAPKDVTPQVVRAFINDEIERRSPCTANHAVTVLRVFFNFLVNDGFLATSPMAGVQKVRCRKAIIETFTLEQIDAVLDACDKGFTGIRDRAIILTLFDAGLRASELCGMGLADVNWTEQTMVVVGKGDRERVVSFGKVARHALALYVARRGQLETDRVFVTCYGDPINRHRLRRIIRTRRERAGITGVRPSPHTLRHSFAIAFLRSGGDLFALQRLLGHSDLAMTRRYAELTQTDVLDKHRAHSPGDTLRIVKPTKGRKRIA